MLFVIHHPWIVMGDFNSIQHDGERIGGVPDRWSPWRNSIDALMLVVLWKSILLAVLCHGQMVRKVDPESGLDWIGPLSMYHSLLFFNG